MSVKPSFSSHKPQTGGTGGTKIERLKVKGATERIFSPLATFGLSWVTWLGRERSREQLLVGQSRKFWGAGNTQKYKKLLSGDLKAHMVCLVLISQESLWTHREN